MDNAGLPFHPMPFKLFYLHSKRAFGCVKSKGSQSTYYSSFTHYVSFIFPGQYGEKLLLNETFLLLLHFLRKVVGQARKMPPLSLPKEGSPCREASSANRTAVVAVSSSRQGHRKRKRELQCQSQLSKAHVGCSRREGEKKVFL